MIRLGSPSISSQDIDAVTGVLRSGQLVQGPEVAVFEQHLAAVLSAKHVIVMSSCTSALEVALRSIGVGTGDLVITSSYSWIATANVIENVGATPVFVDIDPSTYNLDIEALRATLLRLGRGGLLPNLRALLPVDAFGYVADLDQILKLADEIGVPVIEDAACALGAKLDGKAAGTFGLIGCLSFHPRKAVTSGEGGALVTDNDTIADFARAFRNHGQMPNSPHAFGIFGHNYRLTDAMAALGTSQLSRLDESLEVRRSLMQAYTSRLQGLVGLPAIDDERHAGQSFVVVLPAHVNRADLMAKLLTRGIETGTGTIAIPFAAPYRLKYGFADDDFPRLAEIHESLLALPLHTNLSLDELEYISSTLVELLAR